MSRCKVQILLFVLLAIPAAIASPLRAQEQTDGATLSVSYIGDLWTVVDGAEDDSLVYLENADIALEVDLEHTFEWQGATVFLRGLYNNANSISEIAGDAQIVSNIETGVNAVRLYEAWLEQKIGQRFSLKAGLYDLNSEFDVLDSAGLFINSAHGIGSVIGLSGENGPSIFPVTSLGVRVSVEPADGWIIRSVLLDGVPGDPENPDETTIKLGDGDGAVLVSEVEAPFGPGKLLFGHWRYTSDFETFKGDASKGNDGWYLRVEQQLLSGVTDEETSLTGFVRFGVGEGRFNAFDRFVSGGIAISAPLESRPSDAFGVALAAAFPSDQYKLATGSKSTEVNLELTYSAKLTNWLRIQPDIQYIFNPSGSPAGGNVLVAGIRFKLGFQF